MLGHMSNFMLLPKSTTLLLASAALCSMTLSACAPSMNALSNVIDTSPSRTSAGPLIVGQTWAIDGQLAATSVSKTLNVARLVEVQDGSGTLSVTEQASAAQLPSSGYQYVAYTNSDQLKKVVWMWNEGTAGNGIDRYRCQASYIYGSSVMTGVLTLQRQNDSAIIRGTCTATPTNPPPLPKPEANQP